MGYFQQRLIRFKISLEELSHEKSFIMIYFQRSNKLGQSLCLIRRASGDGPVAEVPVCPRRPPLPSPSP